MILAADTLAEAVRLLGVTVMGAALGLVLLRERRIAPFGVALVGGALLASGSLAMVAATVAPFALRREEPVLPLAVEYLQTTSHGPLLLTPILPAVYVLLLLESLRTAEDPELRVLLCWLLGGGLFAMAWLIAAGGHVDSGIEARLAMFAQVLHVTTGLAWVALVVSLLPRLVRGEPLAIILHRVGGVALGLVLLLVISGVISAWLHGVELSWLRSETYGQLLLFKSGVLVLALAAAGWNRFVELGAGPLNEPRLRRVLGGEAVLLLLALLLAAALARTPPPG